MPLRGGIIRRLAIGLAAAGATAAVVPAGAGATTLALRPDSQQLAGMTAVPVSTPHWDILNDDVFAPAPPATDTDYLTSTNTKTQYVQTTLTDAVLPAGEDVTSANVWAYLETGSNRTITFGVGDGAGGFWWMVVPAGSPAGWYSVPLPVPLTQSQVNDLVFSMSHSGGSGSANVVYAAYVQVDTTDPTPPPVDPPTDPVDPPTDPVDPPSDPVDPPSDPVDPPTDPVDPPTDPVDPPTDPVDPPSDPVDPPSDPVDPPSDPVDPPSDPVDPPSDPVDPPSDPVDPPTGPVDPPSDPVDPPTDPVDPPSDPVDPPSDPVDPPTDPVDPPTDPVDPPGDPETVVPPVDPVVVPPADPGTTVTPEPEDPGIGTPTVFDPSSPFVEPALSIVGTNPELSPQGVIPVTVSCDVNAVGWCEGTIWLEESADGSRKLVAARRGPRRYGAKKYKLKPGQRKSIPVRLDRRTAKRFKKKRALKLTVVAEQKDASGNTVTLRRSVRVVKKKKKPKKRSHR